MADINKNGQGAGWGYVTLSQNNFFIDTGLNRGRGLSNTPQSGTQFRLNLNRPEFTTSFPNLIRIEIEDFQMRRTWTNINSYNNIFWIQVALVTAGGASLTPTIAPDGTPSPPGQIPQAGSTNILRMYPIILKQGSYQTFEDVAQVIQDAMNDLFYMTWDVGTSTSVAPGSTGLSIYFHTKMGQGFTDPNSGRVYAPNTVTGYGVTGGGNSLFLRGLYFKVAYNPQLRQFDMAVGDPFNNGVPAPSGPGPADPAPVNLSPDFLNLSMFSPQCVSRNDLLRCFQGILPTAFLFYYNTLIPPPVDDVFDYPNGAMCDSWKILGGLVSRPDFAAEIYQDGQYFSPSYPGQPGLVKFSRIPPQLSTIDILYVVCDLIGLNFMTQDFTTDPIIGGKHELIESNIVGAIPLHCPHNPNIPILMTNDVPPRVPIYQNTEGKLINFMDNFGATGVVVDVTKINTCIFKITDDKLRPLPEGGPGQAKVGNQTASLIIKFKIINLPNEMSKRLMTEGLEGVIQMEQGFTIGAGGSLAPASPWVGSGVE